MYTRGARAARAVAVLQAAVPREPRAVGGPACSQGGRTRGAPAGAHKGRTRQNKIVQNLACQDQNVHTKSDEETAENVADNLVDTARLRIDAASVTRVQSNHATLNLPI